MSELKIVFVGHVDHGKSTIIGRLLFETKSLPQGIIDKVQKIADETGKNFEYAYLLDAFAEERQQGITIDMTQIQFSTEKRDYLIIDAPGHKEFLKNMISGAANANVAFLVIDAAAGVQEQSKRHAYLLSLLGIAKIYVLVNKIDLVDYSQKRFYEVVAEMKNFLETINVKPKEFIPISGFYGDNVTSKSDKLSWYTGETLIQTLDSIEADDEITQKSLRLPIQDVYKFDDRRIIAGRIESGKLQIGDKIKIYPEGRETKITEIAYWLEKDKKNKAVAGESVGIIVEDEFFNKRGEIITKVEDKSPKISNRIRASVFWLGKNPLTIGTKYKLKLATSEIEAEVEKILRVVDAATLKKDESAQKLKINDIGEIIFKLKKKLAFDKFSENQATGRFVIVDGYDVSGGGIILNDAEIKKLQMGKIPDFVLDYVIEELKKIKSGEIIFIAQDGYLMGVEINNRRRIADWSEKFDQISDEICENLKNEIISGFLKLKYGRLVVKIQKGKITQIESTVQQKFTGLDGEGI